MAVHTIHGTVNMIIRIIPYERSPAPVTSHMGYHHIFTVVARSVPVNPVRKSRFSYSVNHSINSLPLHRFCDCRDIIPHICTTVKDIYGTLIAHSCNFMLTFVYWYDRMYTKVNKGGIFNVLAPETT